MDFVFGFLADTHKNTIILVFADRFRRWYTWSLCSNQSTHRVVLVYISTRSSDFMTCLVKSRSIGCGDSQLSSGASEVIRANSATTASLLCNDLKFFSTPYRSTEQQISAPDENEQFFAQKMIYYIACIDRLKYQNRGLLHNGDWAKCRVAVVASKIVGEIGKCHVWFSSLLLLSHLAIH